MSKKIKPFLAHSELTDFIYIIDENDKYEVTEQCISAMKATNRMPRWIPVSERLPEDLEPVNITWVNHNPEGYYADIKDKPFTATGHYCKGRWYWYSSTCQDYLEEYGRCDVDEIDTDIEVTAWMPLPEPYKSKIPTGQFVANGELYPGEFDNPLAEERSDKE